MSANANQGHLRSFGQNTASVITIAATRDMIREAIIELADNGWIPQNLTMNNLRPSISVAAPFIQPPGFIA